MTVKRMLGVGPGSDGDRTISAAVLVPVGVAAVLLAIVLGLAIDGGGFVSFLVIAVAMGAVVPVSGFVDRRRRRRTN